MVSTLCLPPKYSANCLLLRHLSLEKKQWSFCLLFIHVFSTSKGTLTGIWVIKYKILLRTMKNGEQETEGRQFWKKNMKE